MTDVFQQLVDNKLDILWVVDDSGSMSEEQALLGTNFGSFIAFADALGVDYQLGVTTTEINDAPRGRSGLATASTRSSAARDANRAQAFDCAANVTSPPVGNTRPNPLDRTKPRPVSKRRSSRSSLRSSTTRTPASCGPMRGSRSSS